MEVRGSVIGGATSFSAAPGSSRIYTYRQEQEDLVVFSRNAMTGALSFVETHSDDAANGNGLQNLRDVVVSPDGKNVYTASAFDSAVTTFDRGADGTLAHRNTVRDGEGGFDELGGASAVAVSPDGEQVYVTTQLDHTLLTFDRDPSTGALAHVESLTNSDPFFGLYNALTLVVSPDGRGVYATGGFEGRLAAFRRD